MGASIRLDSRAVAADPFPVYERLRREAPVFRTRMRMSSLGDAEVFALSRYRDCVDLITDDRMRRTVKGPESLWLPKAFQLVTTDSMIVKDRPEHSRLRKLASRMFSRIATARMSDPRAHPERDKRPCSRARTHVAATPASPTRTPVAITTNTATTSHLLASSVDAVLAS
jgi:cytochrome P450